MLEFTLRIGFSLTVVLGLMWAFGRMYRNRTRRHGGALDVIARRQLTRGGAVAVVRVADRTLVLGVTDQRVSLLAEADLPAEPSLPAGRPVTTVDEHPWPPATDDPWTRATDEHLTPPATDERPWTPETDECLRPPATDDHPWTRATDERFRPPVTTIDGVARPWLPGQQPRRGSVPSVLAGSILSARTWRDTIEFFRERTVRRS